MKDRVRERGAGVSRAFVHSGPGFAGLEMRLSSYQLSDVGGPDGADGPARPQRGASLCIALMKDANMRNFDLTPLYRASVGFDRMADVMDRALSADVASYPPYNIEKTGENAYRIAIAVAGFGAEDLNVEVRDGAVIVSGRKAAEDEGRTFLHRGIATRAFERRFTLADHVRVEGASHQDGMLNIDLVREIPEALKPRRIEIAKTPARVGKLDA